MPLWERQLNVLRCLNPAELLISGPADLAYPESVLVVRDPIPDCGPLGGIFACLEAARSELLLVLAVDLPAINPAYLESLVRAAAPARGIVPLLEDDLEPVAAIYPREAAPIARRFLAQRQRSVRAFARELERLGLLQFQVVAPEDRRLFRNWNSPADVGSE